MLDDGRSAPTLALLVGTDASHALELAFDDLKANLHHQVTKAWAGSGGC